MTYKTATEAIMFDMEKQGQHILDTWPELLNACQKAIDLLSVAKAYKGKEFNCSKEFRELKAVIKKAKSIYGRP